MTAHRYLCTEEIADPFGSGHRHICEREVDRHLTRYVPTRVEHECACGTTWILPSPKPLNEDEVPWIGPFTWLAWKWRNRSKDGSRVVIFLLAGFTLVGLMCVGSLLGEGLGWW